jgi:hypothetical protein
LKQLRVASRIVGISGFLLAAVCLADGGFPFLRATSAAQARNKAQIDVYEPQ